MNMLDTFPQRIKALGLALGFDAVGIADTNLASAEDHLTQWLAEGRHGKMDYMAHHGVKRARPNELVPGTKSIISVRMNYLSRTENAHRINNDPEQAIIAHYARGRDYHKVLRSRLLKFAQQIQQEIGPFGYRVFTDSAPVLEVELARKSGLGWRGKHTLLLSRETGSYFFLGEIYTDLSLPADKPVQNHCGSCRRCIDICPTDAITAPYQLDARRCIAYLTIELAGTIPEEFRPLIGNRVYGCDDCQAICPWNKYAKITREPDFAVRHGLDKATLVELFAWSAEDFRARMSGSPIYRIGYERWLRNLAVGLGNAPSTPEILAALRKREHDPSELVREHVAWALARHLHRSRRITTPLTP